MNANSKSCLRFFPEAEPNWVTNPLRPSGKVKFQTFLWRRKLNASVFLFLGLLVYYASPTTFFWYLTGWAVYADATLYTVLCFAHWLNGDF